MEEIDERVSEDVIAAFWMVEYALRPTERTSTGSLGLRDSLY